MYAIRSYYGATAPLYGGLRRRIFTPIATGATRAGADAPVSTGEATAQISTSQAAEAGIGQRTESQPLTPANGILRIAVCSAPVAGC